MADCEVALCSKKIATQTARSGMEGGEKEWIWPLRSDTVSGDVSELVRNFRRRIVEMLAVVELFKLQSSPDHARLYLDTH